MRAAGAEPEVGVGARIEVGLVGVEVDRRRIARVRNCVDDGARVERHDVDGEADLLQLVADDRRAALEVRPALLREQREARRPVLSRPRARRRRSIGQADRRRAAPWRPPGRAASAAARPVPDLVGRRLRAVDRHAGAEEHRVGEQLAIDRHRDRAAQLVALQPGARAGRRANAPGFRLNQRPSALRETPRSSSFTRPCVGRALQRRVGLGRDLARHHVELPRLEPQQLRVLVRDDLDDEAIEIRQRGAVRRLAEVVRVAREDEALARHVLAQHERAEADDLGRRRVEPPGVRERAGLRAPRSSLWRGRIGRLSRMRMPGANGAGNVMTTVCGIGCGRPAASCRRPAASRPARCALFSSYAASNENSTSSDVNGWPSEKTTSRRSVSVTRRPSAAVVQLSASHGSTSCVAWLMRTSLACVRVETRSVVVSRAA